MKSTNNTDTLPLPNPDFTAIKSSLKEFMRNYEDLKDYDFDGSTLSILLDTLSYNSHLNAFWLNMVGNEAFLKTAVKRNSVVSAARDLGYTPTSARSASTTLHVEFEPKDTTLIKPFIDVYEGTAFTAATDTSSYTFNLLDRVQAYYDSSVNKYIAEDITVYEGRMLLHEWEVVAKETLGEPNKVADITNDGISIPNLNVDSSLLKVFVNEVGHDVLDGIYRDGNGYALYSEYDNSLNIDKDSRVYFISEDELGRVNISFGNNRLGFKPPVGSKITVSYIVSSGNSANGIGKFNYASSIDGVNVTSVIPLYPSSGGSFPESVESIKHNAQLSYESQGNAIVKGDYEFLVSQVYPNAKKVISWAGQDMNPPQYGKVFVSVQPKDGEILTEKDKNSIKKYLNSRNIITINPVIIDPDYLDINLNVLLSYSTAQTSAGLIHASVIDAIKEFERNKLQTFNRDLDYSRLLSVIDNASTAIQSNITDITISKRLVVNTKQPREYTLNFGNELKPGSLKSTFFSYSSFKNCYFKANNNMLSVYSGDSLVLSDAGTVDYVNGLVTIRPLKIVADNAHFDKYSNSYYIQLEAVPKSNNIKSNNNQILNIDKILVNHLVK